MRKGSANFGFGSSSLSLLTTRECCRCKAALKRSFEHEASADRSLPLAYPLVLVVQERGKQYAGQKCDS
jgi:hypothetical protein